MVCGVCPNLWVKPHDRPVLLQHEGGRVLDDVVDASADAERVHHQRDAQPKILVADGSKETALLKHRQKMKDGGGRADG